MRICPKYALIRAHMICCIRRKTRRIAYFPRKQCEWVLEYIRCERPKSLAAPRALATAVVGYGHKVDIRQLNCVERSPTESIFGEGETYVVVCADVCACVRITTCVVEIQTQPSTFRTTSVCACVFLSRLGRALPVLPNRVILIVLCNLM